LSVLALAIYHLTRKNRLQVVGLKVRSVRAAEPGILPGAGAQIKNQEPELSLKLRTGAGDMAI